MSTDQKIFNQIIISQFCKGLFCRYFFLLYKYASKRVFFGYVYFMRYWVVYGRTKVVSPDFFFEKKKKNKTYSSLNTRMRVKDGI